MNNMVMTKTGCLHEIFEEQVDNNPLKEALICGSKSMTYQDLDHHSNQLAHYLRSFNIGPGSLVGIYLERSEKHIIALLAILKAGAGYVPIDSTYPMDRVEHIIKDAAISVLLTQQVLSEKIATIFNGTQILLDSHSDEISKQPASRISCEESGVTPDNLCYVIYTSGTTGRPKGIMTEHRNVFSFIPAFNQVCKIDTTDRIYHGFPLGFDGSVEEMWMAFSNGATLIIGTKEVVGFGNETACLINKHKVTFFSTVPTFLSMIKEDLPTVRLLIVSGEQCPSELVSKWAVPDRRMLNVYGPTEATVNTTVEECKPGKPITIGKPLPGYETYILDDKKLPVEHGQTGELYIGGAGVARGYLNQQELTEKYFLKNPLNGSDKTPLNFYRTGDLVRLNENNDLVFLRRIDNQVKVRGFRIELSEIESVLLEHPGVGSAVVKVIEEDGIKDIAAYVVKDTNSPTFDRNDILNLLQNRLPSYMIPSYLDLVSEIPILPSGKVDRKSLPEAHIPLVRTDREIIKPATEFEQKVTDIWEKVLHVSSISTEDDFFLDLGGHSLFAAHVVTLLRNDLHISEISIRDMYQNPTIKKFAKHLESLGLRTSTGNEQEKRPQKKLSSKTVYNNIPRPVRRVSVALQTVSLYILYGLGTVPFVVLYLLYLSAKNGNIPIEFAVGTGIALTIGLFPAMFFLSVAAKWLIIGRYKPGKYPVWGLYYFRWWLVSRFQMLSGAGFLEGTPVMNLYYRLMGAKIGRNCMFDTSSCSIFDLVSIGHDTSIGSDTSLLGYKIEDGMLIIGDITIGSNCFIGMHSSIGINTRIGDDARLDDLSLLADEETIEPGESRLGSPSGPAHVAVPETPENKKGKRHPVVFGLLHLLSIYAIELFLLVTAIPSIVLFYWAYKTNNLLTWVLIIIASIPIFEICFCLFMVVVKAVVLPRTKPGIYSTESFFYLRKWFIDGLFNMSRLLVLPIYTTLYLPPWLRMLGAKIGARAELSIVGLTSPDLFVAKDESFFADGSIIGGNRYFGGYVEIARTEVGKRSFVGNNALVPNGKNIGNNNLIGVLSAPPVDMDTIPDGTEWLGSPSFRLPTHQKVEGFSEIETYNPTKKLIFKRLMVDTLRIIIPSIIEICGLILMILSIHILCINATVPVILALTPLIGLGTSIVMALSVVVVKNLLMGEYKPTIKPLWSPYVWYNEVVNGTYEGVGAPMLSLMLGTPFFTWYLRLLGCKIGKHVYIGTTLLGEFDLVEIGDYSAINNGVVIQNHLFEDRIFKASKLKIGDECSVGNNSVVLYDTEMQQGSSIGPLSLLMKGETLPPHTAWYGIPTGTQGNDN